MSASLERRNASSVTVASRAAEEAASWRPDPGDDVAGAPDVSVAGVAKKA
ncbi:hypothetical protein [Streptomyces werraensis]